MKNSFRMHFIGIGGAGMSGLAEVFHNQGHIVQGSDESDSEVLDHLRKLGVKVCIGHDADFVNPCDVVVASTAIKSDNPEILRARELQIPVIPRAEMLSELMRDRIGFSMTGTHGKTTTTTMLGQIFLHAKIDPTVVVGGKVELFGGNAKLGAGRVVVAEADESDGSFLLLPATYAIITNIDTDHLDHYGSIETLDWAFINFVRRIPFYGHVFCCADDPGVQRILPHLTKPFTLYGLSDEADFQGKILKEDPLTQTTTIEVRRRAKNGENIEVLGNITLPMIGRHNVTNAIGALGLALHYGISFDVAADALRVFKNARRRFDLRYKDEKRDILVLDDYGHHPTEIRAVMETAIKLKRERLRVVFQPHRYTRTQLCFREFLDAFQGCDELILLPIYAAGESPIAGVSSVELAKHIRGVSSVRLAESLEEAALWIAEKAQPGDTIITLGAGDITKLPDLIQSALNR